jgi:hypothetical protein
LRGGISWHPNTYNNNNNNNNNKWQYITNVTNFSFRKALSLDLLYYCTYIMQLYITNTMHETLLPCLYENICLHCVLPGLGLIFKYYNMSEWVQTVLTVVVTLLVDWFMRYLKMLYQLQLYCIKQAVRINRNFHMSCGPFQRILVRKIINRTFVELWSMNVLNIKICYLLQYEVFMTCGSLITVA